jgi:outer membrane usher protein FimD/PapC
MATIMALATRLACALAGLLLVGAAAWASDIAVPSTYSPLPTGYSLSYDKDQWTDEFSVFHMAVADQLGLFSSGAAASDDPRLRSLTRLDSSWSLTAPLLALPMRVGDGVSSAGFWDQPARIGGIQIGTLQPAIPAVVAPPSLIGLPYDVVGPTPLSTSHFIDHTRTLVQFQNQALVSVGQADFSLESGRLRENFEVRSGDYGPWITSGTYRYGVNAATTVNGEVAQVSGQQSFVGVGVLEGLGPLGLVSAKVASSHDPDSSGWLARMGYDYNHDRFNIAVRSHIQSQGFQDVGDASTVESFRHRTLASAGVDLGSMGKISLASATQTYSDDSRRDIIALSHAMPFGGGGVVSTAAAYSPGQLGNAAVLLSFSYPFDYLAAPAHTIDGAVNSALDRTIVDAFSQTRTAAAHPITDRSAQE